MVRRGRRDSRPQVPYLRRAETGGEAGGDVGPSEFEQDLLAGRSSSLGRAKATSPAQGNESGVNAVEGFDGEVRANLMREFRGLDCGWRRSRRSALEVENSNVLSRTNCCDAAICTRSGYYRNLCLPRGLGVFVTERAPAQCRIADKDSSRAKQSLEMSIPLSLGRICPLRSSLNCELRQRLQSSGNAGRRIAQRRLGPFVLLRISPKAPSGATRGADPWKYPVSIENARAERCCSPDGEICLSPPESWPSTGCERLGSRSKLFLSRTTINATGYGGFRWSPQQNTRSMSF